MRPVDGAVAEVRAAARASLNAAASHRLILSPGCGVPRGTPIENAQALVEATGRDLEQVEAG